MMTHQRWSALAAGTAFVVGTGLMVLFDSAPTRIGGVTLLFAFIVLGVFTIASPSSMDDADGADKGVDSPER